MERSWKQLRSFLFSGEIMASVQLQNAWNSYKKHMDFYMEHGKTNDELISLACYAAASAIKGEGDIPYGLEICKETKKFIDHSILYKMGGTFWQLERYAQEKRESFEYIDQGFHIYQLEAPYRFESFMFYLEKDRKYEKRFYVPRRKTLGIVVQDLQDLEDDLLDVYSISLPSRTGKSTILDMFMAFIGLKRPDSHNAYGGHSGQLAKRFFRGLDNITSTEEYNFQALFKEIHPTYERVIESKSSDPAEFTINLGAPSDFPTYTCRGIDGTWTGAIDVSSDGYLCVDDLVRDREHSLSPSRMENTYQEYQNKMLDRLNDGAKRILCGTLWSVLDPIERERKLYENNPRARFRKIPALNEYDESNFQYEVKGFSTKYYVEMRNRLEKIEWMAKFQQSPFVRDSLTFPVEELRFFDGNIPDGICKTVATCDPAFGAGDSLSMPICKDFGGTDKFIVDWVHDKRSTAFTIPEVADKIDEHMITELQVEKNRGGDLFAEQLQKELDARGILHCKITLKNAMTKNKFVGMSKEERISGYSDFVKRNFQFLRVKKWDVETNYVYQATEQYRKAIDEMTMFSAESKRQADDSADAITQLAMMFEAKKVKRATITSSWF